MRPIGAVVLMAGLLLSGCAARRFELPAGPGQPFPEFAQLFEDATKTCRDIRTLTAEASLSGRVVGQRVRGRLHLGLAEPDALRIEAVAPFGPPVFVLVAQQGEGTLVLPRDRAAVRAVSAAELIEALAGVKLSADELRTVATGCVAPAASPRGGQRYPNGLTAIALQGEAMAYVAIHNGVPQIAAAHRPGLFVRYMEYANGLPRKIVLSSEPSTESSAPHSRGEPRTTLTLELSQVETNVQLEPAAFKVDVPADARPLTLDELRRNGPLGRAAGKRIGG